MRALDHAAPGERYVIVSDDNCHYYVIPLAKRDHWNAWVEKLGNGEAEDDPDLYEAPDYASALDGGPGGVSFLAPEHR